MKENHPNIISIKALHQSTLYSLWCRFYPLAMSDFAMTLGDTLRTIALGFMPLTELSLAAIGIVKSIAVFLESPIIMIIHASTALNNNQKYHRALWRFTILASGILTSIFLLFAVPVMYRWLFFDVFGASFEITTAAEIAFYLMVPWPAIIAVRRFFQGILVYKRQEKAMANAAFLRLIFTIFILVVGIALQGNGVVVAGLSLIVAVAVETLVVIYYARTVSTKTKGTKADVISLGDIGRVARYYAPLGSTALFVWGGRAMLVAIIARSSDSLLALASWTAVGAFVLPIANATRMLQQIVIASGKDFSDQSLKNFAMVVGIAFSAPLVLVGFTDSGNSLIGYLLGGEMSKASIHAIQILSLLPLLVCLQNLYQGFLILYDAKWFINWATIINIGSMLIMSITCIFFGFFGAQAAAWATLIGQVIEVLLLYWKAHAGSIKHSRIS